MRKDIERAACRKAYNEAHRAHRISLRPGDSRAARQRAGTCEQMQKLASHKIHVAMLFVGQ